MMITTLQPDEVFVFGCDTGGPSTRASLRRAQEEVKTMAVSFPGVLLVLALVGNGLLAGLFAAFSWAVVPGLRHVDDRSFIETFRAINSAILTPGFLVVFLGTPVVTVAVTASHLGPGQDASVPWLLAGTVCSVLSFGITAAVNVPLNRRLDAASTVTEAERRHARVAFEAPWSRWNLARLATSTAALALLALSALA